MATVNLIISIVCFSLGYIGFAILVGNVVVLQQKAQSVKYGLGPILIDADYMLIGFSAIFWPLSLVIILLDFIVYSLGRFIAWLNK